MTLSTRAAIRQEVLRRIGGHIATATGGSTTTIAAETMIGRGAGDDISLVGWGLYEPTDAAADAYRIITGWDDSTGTATVDTIGARANTEVHEYWQRNDPTPYEANEAINRVLSESERIVQTAIPTVEGQREYTLRNAPWVDVRRDVQGVYRRESPNILDNSGFELWGVGTDAGLHGWTLAGTSGTVTRVDGEYGRYAARLTRSSNNVTLTQTVPIPIIQLYGKSLSVFARVKSATAAYATIDISDGTDTTSTSAHDGGSDWDELTATHTVNADAVGPLTVVLNGKTSDANADFENVVVVEGTSVPDWLKKYGDQNARTKGLSWDPLMTSSVPAIRIARAYNRGSQIVVESKQPYFELTADSSTGGVTDLPFEAAVAGTIVKLAEVHSAGKPNAARWERLGAYWLPKYNAWKRRLTEAPAERDETQARYRGA